MAKETEEERKAREIREAFDKANKLAEKNPIVAWPIKDEDEKK